MALTPANPANSDDKRRQRDAAQEDVLLREVDEAVRQDEMAALAQRYAKPVIAIVVAGLLGFAGFLYWQQRNEAQKEKQSETLVAALDQLERGNLETANKALGPLAQDGDAAAKASAQLLQAGIAMELGKSADAVAIYTRVAADSSAPQALRDLAVVREIAATYDQRKPDEVIAKLKPLAVQGKPYFGSAGEMVAMAYIEQGKPAEAGALLAAIAKDKDVPDSLRSRARQVAGMLGVDAVVDVEEVLDELGSRGAAPQGQQAQ